MSPMHMSMAPMAYTPISDAMDRHEYGITKNRKTASTGGGRAWSEDEEVYLLQTRLQKMPYKHIAAHLKKTELACRLHYHQLSHGSNRRKRTTSVSSGSSTGGHSPNMQATMPSPIHESRSVSPTGSAGSYRAGSPVGHGIQLPSIMSASNNSNDSPRLPAILPKPASMGLTIPPPNSSRGYSSSALSESGMSHNAPLLPAANFAPSHSQTHHPSLRLDCNVSLPLPQSAPHSQIDLSRLSAIYSAHRTGFWSAIAAEYGPGVSAAALEQAWNNHAQPINKQQQQQPYHYGHQTPQQTVTPITPVLSPEDREAYNMRAASDKTRISAILGIDADPRSPKEREIVRRMEERVAA
ncbi:hypothetical protein MCOR25_000635 [Pyricularia grisea]|uniref:Myb-like domain-containing protein n=1 Tax=Pyricularia grisea TaxID=148305 RepID=A0A6P8AVM1_PYRGI|nr:uncharacterized protein PgNI_08106 [Pyricularia grisea]KAI6382635.1 hypothetical protein MCOR25_000635 [Pyricularia grisea]TLD06271.1 hypothetical protein PgNI_08106 [Pyricularia grisea]